MRLASMMKSLTRTKEIYTGAHQTDWSYGAQLYCCHSYQPHWRPRSDSLNADCHWQVASSGDEFQMVKCSKGSPFSWEADIHCCVPGWTSWFNPRHSTSLITFLKFLNPVCLLSLLLLSQTYSFFFLSFLSPLMACSLSYSILAIN